MGSKIMGGDAFLKKKLAILFFGLFITLVAIEVYYKFDGTLGFLLVLFATWSLLAAIFLGGYLKEAVEVILDFFLG